MGMDKNCPARHKSLMTVAHCPYLNKINFNKVSTMWQIEAQKVKVEVTDFRKMNLTKKEEHFWEASNKLVQRFAHYKDSVVVQCYEQSWCGN